ncbi:MULTISPECIES: PIG-L deacetylase family protein [unclassified Pseudonocardia]|uniref:PIG-L deacetylase family protein n=1 Tax=unclassified Pseudonocardia TaxID=2619320 RepID=UPI00095CB900|nr:MULTISPECIES: PIG-L deacetylase family protein [unclassified Pseudonocardia]MBN9098397.1 PIG-L family deacetylase [Pseudonocardia sp.]OJY52628.1 MAG: PIG-L domain-containing protein [Pseudonocardia sp. 73-21]
MPTPLTDVERVLVVTAHPDDVDFGAAATVASWTQAGIEVSYCICTSGDAGGFDDTPRADMAPLREAEQLAAAKEVGVQDVTFLHYPDGRLTPSVELRRDISREIRRVRPQRVLTQSPEIYWKRVGASHPDHRAAGEAALAAVYPDARNPFAHPELLADEGLEAWTVPEMWIMAAPEERTDHVVDVTATMDRKIAALLAHTSQTAHMDDLEGRLRGMAGLVARRFDLPEGTLAEAFQIVSIG